MFAPLHHAAMKHVVPIRRELGVRTIFNFSDRSPIPAGARHQVIGVSDPQARDYGRRPGSWGPEPPW